MTIPLLPSRLSAETGEDRAATGKDRATMGEARAAAPALEGAARRRPKGWAARLPRALTPAAADERG